MAKEEFSKGRYLETFSNLILALLRMKASFPHVQTCRRNWFGKKLTQEDFDGLITEIISKRKNDQDEIVGISLNQTKGIDDPIDLENDLAEKGYSSFITKIDLINIFKKLAYGFDEEKSPLELKRMKFSSCHIDTSYHKTKFEGCCFVNCDFKYVNFNKTSFVNSQFICSNLSGVSFYANSFSRVLFLGNAMNGTSFNDSTMDTVGIIGSSLSETNFLGVKATDSFLAFNDLTDCLLANANHAFRLIGNTPHQITRPVVGIAWHFRNRGSYAAIQAERIKRDYSGIVMKFEYAPQQIDPVKLNKEVEESLSNRGLMLPKGTLSYPDALLKEATSHSEIGKIKIIITEMMPHMDAVVIPGGEDIEPELYGE